MARPAAKREYRGFRLVRSPKSPGYKAWKATNRAIIGSRVLYGHDLAEIRTMVDTIVNNNYLARWR